jgi:MSHA pilin protein MshC
MIVAPASQRPYDSRTGRGFSLLELVGVLLIAAILAAVVVPKFWGSRFDDAAFADETRSALRFAQRSAVTMRRSVCVTFTSTTAVFTYDPTAVTTTCSSFSPTCSSALPPPEGGSSSYTVTARGSASYSSVPTNFNFNCAGAPSTAQTINFPSGQQIVVEALTGYVR